MKFDFTKIRLTSIDGKVLEDADVYKTIANLLYHHAKTLDLVEVAMAINKGEAVELEKSEISEIKQLISDPNYGMFSYARRAVLDFIKSVQK